MLISMVLRNTRFVDISRVLNIKFFRVGTVSLNLVVPDVVNLKITSKNSNGSIAPLSKI